MNQLLLLGHEMGLAFLKNPATPIKECWAQAQATNAQTNASHLSQRIEKGAFPQQLGRLRGQLSLEASGDAPVVIVLECGPRVLTLFANDADSVYGVWDVTQARFHPLKAEQMYGTHLTTLIKDVCQNVGSVWVAYFLSAFSPTPTPNVKANDAATPMTPMVTIEEEEELPAAAAAAVVAPKKKTVVRKRPATVATATTAAEPIAKKSAAVVVLTEENSGVGGEI